MNDHNEHIIGVLHRLIETCRDGNEGYRNAAEHIKPEYQEVKTILYRLSQQRALFEADLRDELRHLGGNPDIETGGVTGTIHRAWINFKAKLSTDDLTAVLSECQNGDAEAAKVYEDALKDDKVPGYLKEILAKQHHLIQGTHMQLEELQEHPN